MVLFITILLMKRQRGDLCFSAFFNFFRQKKYKREKCMNTGEQIGSWDTPYLVQPYSMSSGRLIHVHGEKEIN